MESRPFILLKDSRLGELRVLLEGIAGKWVQEWCGGTDSPAVDCARAWDIKHPQEKKWNKCHADNGKAVWFSFAEEAPKELQRAMFGSEQRYAGQNSGKHSLAQDAALAAIEALTGNIAKAFGLSGKPLRTDEAPSPDTQFRRGSGAVTVEIAIGKLHLLCLLNDKCSGLHERTISQPGAKPITGIDLKRKFSGTPLSLQVELGSTEVDIGSLLTLQIGDVIRLDSTIDQPLALIGAEGRKVLNGYLGKQDGNMAIEVVALKQ